nr:MAG TPA: hypothetical protein [Caudoviricetes sp.]
MTAWCNYAPLVAIPVSANAIIRGRTCTARQG